MLHRSNRGVVAAVHLEALETHFVAGRNLLQLLEIVRDVALDPEVPQFRRLVEQLQVAPLDDVENVELVLAFEPEAVQDALASRAVRRTIRVACRSHSFNLPPGSRDWNFLR